MIAVRERLREILVDEPVLISLTLRWFGWLVALVIVVLEAAPTENLRNGPLVLTVTFLQLAVMSVYPAKIRPRMPAGMEDRSRHLWPLIDGAVALWAIYLTGGWDSPFYHFGVTVVLAPSLRFGLGGALVSSTLFALGFLLVVGATSTGFTPAYSGNEVEPDLVSSPLNPLMIALYAAFLGEVIEKLRREMERSKRLAAENERARMARDIHDGVSQTLFMLAMSLETGQVLAQREGAEKTHAHLRSLTPVAQKALLELRDAMHGPDPLSGVGESLEQAVATLVRDYRSATGKAVECEVESGFTAPPELASSLFPMIQESLANACQHSGGDTILVALRSGEIVIRDNGSGFEKETVRAGRGLRNLEKRASECGLDYTLRSGEGGTVVRFSWEEDDDPNNAG